MGKLELNSGTGLSTKNETAETTVHNFIQSSFYIRGFLQSCELVSFFGISFDKPLEKDIIFI